MKVGDIINKRFGRLLVLSCEGKYRDKDYLYKCQCDCGNIKLIARRSLISSNTKSCGCIKIEKLRQNKKHGLRKHPLYKIWYAMKDRCHNKNCIAYKNYGGRGIKVCDEWKNDFKKFYDWANENGYKRNLSIDRINNNGNYEPNNCRWATSEEQGNNKRNNIFIKDENEKICIRKYCRKYNINYGYFWKFLRSGHSLQDTIKKFRGDYECKSNIMD